MSELEKILDKILKEKIEKVIPENIKEDISVFGIVGTYDSSNIQSDIPATNDDIIQEKEAYVNDTKLVGTIADNGAIEIIPSEEKQILPSGYHNGNGRILPIDITTLNNYKTCDSLADAILGDKEPYIELPYVESTGTQYIDTGVVPDGNTIIKIEFMKVGRVIDYERFFGVENQFSILRSKSTSSWEFRADKVYFSFTMDNEKKYLLEAGQGFLNLDSEQKGTYSYVPNTQNTMYLFYSNSADRYGIFRIYSCKIYDDKTLIRDFIPVKDIKGKICLYDKVNSKNYYNKGTGDFIAGEVI